LFYGQSKWTSGPLSQAIRIIARTARSASSGCGSFLVSKYLFLGDDVDRGRNVIDAFTFLLALKIKYPTHIWLLRGNHETQDISRLEGFYAECVERDCAELWERFTDVFLWLPIAAIVSKRIFCVHGGLSPELRDSLARAAL
jgi:serine/threonine-protein phosphatase PP1 catalytic subunit